ncbi:MAG: HisA/HisF-related TIM barrel protein [Eggerthella lenta]
MQTGIEAAAYVRMAEAFGHPVIASGGVAGVDDIVRLGEVAGSIEGVIAGRAVYEGALSVQEGVRACDEATRRAEAAAVQANPCGM